MLIRLPASRRAKVEFYRALISRCMIFAGAMMVLAGLAGSADDGGDALLGLLMGIAICIAGLAGSWWYALPAAVPRREVFVAAGLTWLVMIAVSALFYVLSGTLRQIDKAIVESVAGFCTTGFSVIASPEDLSRTVLFWRAGTQWLGGLGAISFALLLIPMFKSGGGDGRVSLNAARFQKHRSDDDFMSFLKLYCGLTAVLAAAYWAAGMGIFDGITHSGTTVSTGGFSNYSAGFFGGSAVQWVAIAGMFLAGINGALLFKSLRGSPGSLWRSLEFKVYAGLVVAASAVCLIWADVAGFGERLRHALFSVASAVSTTGFRLADWGDWGVGLQMLILLLIATGAMVGSASGGFQILRATEAAHYLAREVRGYAASSSRTQSRHDFLGEEPLARMQAFSVSVSGCCGARGFRAGLLRHRCGYFHLCFGQRARYDGAGPGRPFARHRYMVAVAARTSFARRADVRGAAFRLSRLHHLRNSDDENKVAAAMSEHETSGQETSEQEMDERSAEAPASEIRGMTEAFRLASRVKAPLRDLMKSLRLERGQLLGLFQKAH